MCEESQYLNTPTFSLSLSLSLSLPINADAAFAPSFSLKRSTFLNWCRSDPASTSELSLSFYAKCLSPILFSSPFISKPFPSIGSRIHSRISAACTTPTIPSTPPTRSYSRFRRARPAGERAASEATTPTPGCTTSPPLPPRVWRRRAATTRPPRRPWRHN